MRALLIATSLFFSGCGLLDGSGSSTEAPVAPTAEFRQVALVERPSNGQLVAFYCPEIANSTLCSLAGVADAPAKVDLKFSFETVFDLGNDNSFPVPLVELLLALEVFEGQAQAELGAVCISFCEPGAEDCEPNQPDACQADQDVNSLEDFVPTTDQLIELAVAAATGELFEENLSFRYIPARQAMRCGGAEADCETQTMDDGSEQLCCGAECRALGAGCSIREDDEGNTCEFCPGRVEARVRFDLDLDTMLGVLGELADQSVDEILTGALPTFDIPYGASGSLFFDVPVLGRFALGYGPLGGTWSLD